MCSSFLCRSIDLGHFILLFQIVIVIPNVIYNGLIGQIHDPGSCLVNKITVMGNIQHRTGIAVQCLLKDLLGSNIQMVGRLIQDQEVRLGKHKLGKGNTTTLATG